MKNNVLDLFYNYIVKEASTGRVDCFLIKKVLFNTIIVEDNIEIFSKIDNNIYNKNELEEGIDLFIPTLVIKNRKEFDRLLLEYVEKALAFYDDSNFYEEILEHKFDDNELGISKEKLIMTLLWSNATIEDFNDPCSYLRKRIAFFELGSLEKYKNSDMSFYSKTLNANVEVNILKNRLENETPYSIQILLRNTDGKYIFEFPRVYLGIADDVGYIYAIQNYEDRIIDEMEGKKINRRLYGVNFGFDDNKDNNNIYDFGNLKDITHSFLVASNIVMGIFKDLDISKIKIPSILITRWNAKILDLKSKEMRLKRQNKDIKEIEDILEKTKTDYSYIQSNLTDKFLRIFRRLGYHHSTIGIEAIPMELSSEMMVRIYDGIDICNNPLLDETYSKMFLKNNKIR